jgi:ribonuclease E
MANKMLIDAAHPEETRVVVLRGDRVEEFDFESAQRKQLRGNIYLAKVTRVEPSLQAAFVDYGGNRHGFLAFNEIHPDYYQLPKADREALLEVEAEEARQAAKREAEAENQRSNSEDENSDDESDEQTSPENNDDLSDAAINLDAENTDSVVSEEPSNDEETIEASDENDETSEDDEVESVGSEDALEELPERHAIRRKQYKIQEVIKRRQIILVQVVKEERGNKGAALTTYLSLAGRYTVLMPNTARGGGISRKIANPTDRKRLRKIVSELEVPEGMGLIVRTAGASRTKAELKRDFEYLLRLWENVRDHTLQSSAPNLVYEEGNLIKRSIRDLYSKEVEEVLVAGEDEYREAKDFMRMLMPSHAKNVQPYKESEPLFTKYKIESQLNAMYSPYVTLPSGGYIVINQTEALVSIDVNSGRSTKEHSIEETALNTNLEAATEISRQLRLRDLAGLVVIDFIDMEERRNNRAVERRVKECLRHDRARIQVGRISHFGLLEMSRQRLRTGVLEGSTSPCPHCNGTGMIRSTESMALTILRALEDRLLTQRHSVDLACNTNVDVALYILNNKRNYVNDMERRYGVNIAINASADLEGVSYTIEQMRRDQSSSSEPSVVQMDWAHKSTDNEITPRTDTGGKEDGEQEGKSRRRRRRRGGQAARRARQSEDQNRDEIDGENQSAEGSENNQLNDSADAQTDVEARDGESDGEETRARRPRRRGKRGGRRRGNRTNRDAEAKSSEEQEVSTESSDGTASEAKTENTSNEDETAEASSDQRRRSRRSPRRGTRRRSNRSENNDGSENSEGTEAKASNEAKTSEQSSEKSETHSVSETKSEDQPTETKRAPKKGYWSRAKQQKAEKEKSESVKPSEKQATAEKPSVKSVEKQQEKIDPQSLVASKQKEENSNPEPKRGWWQKTNG